MSLSPKALGVFLAIAKFGAPRGVKGLQEAFGWGRDQINSAMAELAAMRLIALSSGKTSKGTFWHKIELTQEGKAFVYDWNQPLQVFPNGETRNSISQNSNIADTYIADITYSSELYGSYANSVNQGGKQSFPQRKEKENMSLGSMPEDPDDIAREQEKDAKRKAEKRKEESESYYRKRQKVRANKPVERWTPTDIVNYFAEQCKTVWQVEQVAITQRPRLVRAMETFRMDNDTDGVLDKKLMDMFLATYKFDHGRLYNPEQLFWTFLNYAPKTIDEARRSLQTVDMDVVLDARAKMREELEAYRRSKGN